MLYYISHHEKNKKTKREKAKKYFCDVLVLVIWRIFSNPDSQLSRSRFATVTSGALPNVAV